MKNPTATCCQAPSKAAQISMTQLARAAIQHLEWAAISRAIDLAIRAHAGQCDKAGAPYIWHPLRVGFSLLPDVDACIAGILHDVFEDSETTDGEVLLAVNGNTDIFQAVCALTRGERERYEDYIGRCARLPMARKVKLADLADNMSPDRQASALARGWNPEHMAELQKRYEAARETLLKAAASG
jgi:(p)ppGpp synthase/HD superfamily hydrolase